MKRSWLWILAVLLLAALLGAPQQAARAQDGLPPTIIDFRVDVETIALPAAEAGETPAIFEWQTVGVGDAHRLALEALVLDTWTAVAPPDDALAASGSLEVLVAHPLSFRPPTYRLAIVDAQGRVLDQWIALIPYDEGVDAPPSIESVMAPVQSISAADLATGVARVPVVWEVSNRRPWSNLVFEQVFDGMLTFTGSVQSDGGEGEVEPWFEGASTVNVELPRATLWIPSRGEGLVAPANPGVDGVVQLRVRLIDLRDGEVLAEALLPPIPLAGGVTQPLEPVTSIPSGVSAAEFPIFTAAPETVPRGGVVTVAWEVARAQRVTVWRLSPTGQIAEEAPITTPVGSWTVTLPDYYVDTASFVLKAFNSAGQMAQAGLTVQIICPYTYFFEADERLACPLGPPRTVQAAWQAFERGLMLWRADTGEILVLYANGGRVERTRDTWQGEPVIVDEAPPADLHQPDRGFGKVWVENPMVREGLGWATTLEQGYTMQYQSTGDFRYPRLYLTLPDGSMIYVVENSWTTVG